MEFDVLERRDVADVGYFVLWMPSFTKPGVMNVGFNRFLLERPFVL